MRSKAHTALTAPLVLHRTKLDKCAKKSSLSMANCGINFFLLSSIVFHLWKPQWTLCAFVKCAMVLAKRPQFLLFSTAQARNEYSPQDLNCCTFVNWKTRKRSNTLKGSQRMGGGQIFLKTYRASLFKKDLSNEPNFGQIHLTGQYLCRLHRNRRYEDWGRASSLGRASS